MRILTCNIRCFGAPDGEDGWGFRKAFCIETMRSRNPDIICFQEMWIQQYADISAGLPGYTPHTMVDEPDGQHPMNSIFFRKNAYALISSGGYWLSESPHVSGTRSWDSKCVRYANWIRLRDHATGIEFRVVNTHLDHISQPARENQARLIAEDAAAYPDGYPQILTGDMNCDCGNKAIDALKAGGWIDSYGKVHGTEDPGHTFHEFKGPGFESTIGKMDWIFMRGNMEAIESEVIVDSNNGRFPSDHYFISATLSFSTPA